MRFISRRPISDRNRARALIRIQRELVYIALRTKPGTPGQKEVRQAIGKLVDAIQDDAAPRRTKKEQTQ